MSELFNKKEYLKNLIKRVNQEKDNEELKKELQSIIRELSAEEIALVEQELMDNEGITIDQIQSVCDVHLNLFKEYIDKEKIEVESWHPIYILMKEHEHIIKTAEKIRDIAKKILEKKSIQEAFPLFMNLNIHIDNLMAAENYFLKEENVLFPYIEKYGITKPPAIMWREHDQVRDLRKKIIKIKDNKNFEEIKKDLYNISLALLELFMNHVHKEHSVLFPTALKLIKKEEWFDIRKQFDEIGYCCFDPEPLDLEKSETEGVLEGKIKLPSGKLTVEQLKYILNTLPIDITFVDANDEVKYFSESKERIFIRSRAILGRKVENCHPPKSVDIVKKIVNDFKSGKRNNADFWLKIGEKYVYIRYFAVRNNKGEYLGTLEVTQDIKPIQEITGERRIYDEKN
ncbi:DUF438 domain-containing protein [Marinitoga sp. 1155]|uniref:DUF438 domain-containing protein n=1 Tax=Marinitoga sp. 1155 TaxID=1428448 RepID=UPI0006411136|nr:DUF438 domain-containing protein [Marinitoga sp. 1155]KLO22597.1 hemerythrin [Marinitoga sp. 1155]